MFVKPFQTDNIPHPNQCPPRPSRLHNEFKTAWRSGKNGAPLRQNRGRPGYGTGRPPNLLRR
ncbi:hypothetical protein HMPREF9413_1809 [Paenibacillus sp. HGF7]|nr:hypothetical protein HMPREF9413_1809 [Paenibacillus sp. HGF7]